MLQVDLLRFSVPGGGGGAEEYAGLGFASGGSVPTQADTMTFQQRI